MSLCFIKEYPYQYITIVFKKKKKKTKKKNRYLILFYDRFKKDFGTIGKNRTLVNSQLTNLDLSQCVYLYNKKKKL